MDLQQAAAVAACSCLDNQKGLETLKTLLNNLVEHPNEAKYQNVSLKALRKRGVTSECLEFLKLGGFEEEAGRLRYTASRGPQLLEALVCIGEILEQKAQACIGEHAQDHAHLDSAPKRARNDHPSTTGSSFGRSVIAVPSDREALRRARLIALDPDGDGASASAPALSPDSQLLVNDDLVGAPVASEDVRQLQPLGSSEIKCALIEMGFSPQQAREAADSVENPRDFETVLQTLLPSLPEQDMEDRAVPRQEGTAPNLTMPQLERFLSDTPRIVLQTIFAEQSGEDSAREAARLLQRVSAALKQGLVSDDQRTELHDRMLAGETGIVREIVGAIGVHSTPDMLLELGEDLWECAICFSGQVTRGWRCPTNHRFCAECMRHHIGAVPLPRCPMCEHKLDETDFVLLNVSQDRLEAFREARLKIALDTWEQRGETLVRCLRSECSNAVVFPSDSGRQRFVCGTCGAAPFCTKCRQTPYHFHADCGRVQPLREQWLAWISGGREDYHGKARIAAENDCRNQALFDSIARHNELEADERWKAANCRLCPSCKRPISKVEGCDSMVCGRAYHGGDQQPGCGREFNWREAEPYIAHARRRDLPSLPSSRMRGRGVFHPFAACSLCGTQGLAGLRFKCIHCKDFEVCSSCESRMANLHEADHVFEIFFESEFRCPWLPRGTKVRIVQSGNGAPRRLTRCSASDLEGLTGTVAARRRLPLEAYRIELDLGHGTVEMDKEFLEPMVASREEAEQLLARTIEKDGEEPVQAMPRAAYPDSEVEANETDDDGNSSDSSGSDYTPPDIRAHRQRSRQVEWTAVE